jgi:hypothetical protein
MEECEVHPNLRQVASTLTVRMFCTALLQYGIAEVHGWAIFAIYKLLGIDAEERSGFCPGMSYSFLVEQSDFGVPSDWHCEVGLCVDNSEHLRANVAGQIAE